MANSTDPDQLASSEANWSGSTLFAKAGLWLKFQGKFSRGLINFVFLNIFHRKLGFIFMLIILYGDSETRNFRRQLFSHDSPSSLPLLDQMNKL